MQPIFPDEVSARYIATPSALAARAWVLVGVILGAEPIAAQEKEPHEVMDPQIHVVNKGQSADLYFQINIKGTVFVKVAAKPGESNCADFWWIKWPLGTVESLGRHCGAASFKIPGLFDFAFSSKLRVGATANQVKIALSASESLVNSARFDF